MAWFEGTVSKKLTVDADLATVRAHFADPKAIVANTNDLERGTIEGDVIHFLLKAQDHAGVAKFQGDYRCRYTLEGDVLRWETLPGANVDQSGRATFTADGARTAVDYTETLKIDMDVPAMAAPLLRPLIGPMLAHELGGFLDRMAKSVPKA